MRIYAPIEVIFDNPYQGRQNYGDIKHFAEQEILPFVDSRPDTLGLQVPPQARLLDGAGTLVDDPARALVEQVLLCQKPPTLDTQRDMLRDKWIGSAFSLQLIFGHRRLRALTHLAAADPRYRIVPLDIVQLEDRAMLAEVYTENGARKNTSAVEDVDYMRHAFALLGPDATLNDVAELLNITPSRARNLWRLRSISPELAEANVAGRLSQAHLEEMIRLERLLPYTEDTDASGERGRTITRLTPPRVAYQEFLSGDHGRSDIRQYVAWLEEESHPLTNDYYHDIEAEGVVQTNCKRCPAKIGTACVNRPCFTIKRTAVRRQYAAQKWPDTPWSDNPAHFPRRNDLLFLIRDAWQRDPTADGLVVGEVRHNGHYGVDTVQARTGHINWTTRSEAESLKHAIIVGHTNLATLEAATQEPSDDTPAPPATDPPATDPAARWHAQYRDWQTGNAPSTWGAIINQHQSAAEAVFAALTLGDAGAFWETVTSADAVSNWLKSATRIFRERPETLTESTHRLRILLAPLDIEPRDPTAEERATEILNAYKDVFAGERRFVASDEPFCHLHDVMLADLPADTAELLEAAMALNTRVILSGGAS
jgi:hypothetical protein